MINKVQFVGISNAWNKSPLYQVPLSRTRTGNENLFDIAVVRDIRTRNYDTKRDRKTRGNGNLFEFEIASCSSNRVRDSEVRLYYTRPYYIGKRGEMGTCSR